MNEDNPSRKKRWGWLKQSQSDSRLAEQRRAAVQNPSSLPPVMNHRGLPELVPKFLRKVTDRSASSARQSSNLESTAASSSAQDLQPVQTTKDLSPYTVLIHEPNPDQSSNLGVAEAEQPDSKFVEGRIADATKGIAGMKNVSGMVQNFASASNDMQSVPDTLDTFSISIPMQRWR
ncbi:hypothetical protein DEU56DRAFT_831517 [Suillus clintonianus]|uniref:uncharacterized protein n=1 Tax=Suillus clintonianus TaxID=1904413 RepID=UPI001B879C18|nr:uncharacterized protein DEU56DRAFT_831517 [Suillus clintonianus]KAG2122743.1 hypothetical protein DEU56DRAFT_831517 [Suillus clintonianus]